MADPVTITVSGATLALVAERLFAYFVSPKMRTKEETAARGERSSDKPPEFWQKEFRDAVMEVNRLQILPLLETMVEGHKEIVDMLHGRTVLFQQQIDLMKELAEVSRRRRR